MKTMGKTLTIAVLSIFFACMFVFQANAAIVDYGVYKVEARITGDDNHTWLSKKDSKAPGLWSTGATAYVSDSYGTVGSAWSINPLTANEAQVNIDMFFTTPGTYGTYLNSSAGETGEVHFNYHSDTPFIVNYYWDLTWGIDNPTQFLNLNFFAQAVKLRVYDSMDNWWDPQWLPPPTGSRYYPAFGNYKGMTSFSVGAGDWLFIVFDSGSKSRFDGEWESLSGNVYLDFDGGARASTTAVPEPSSLLMFGGCLAGLAAIRRKIRR